MVCGFIDETAVHPKSLTQKAYVVQGVGEPAASGGAPAAEAALEPIGPLLAKAKPEEGANIAKQCAACHTFDKGGPNRVGPNLWGVVGDERGKGRGGFNFSAAMKSKGGEWTFDELNKFLANPRGYIPGTNMTFAGISRDSQRADLIAFLREHADSPVALPKAAANAPAPAGGEAPKAPAAGAPPAAKK
jgi:cytochrome c